MSDSKALDFLYHTAVGRVGLKILTLPAISKALGKSLDTKASVKLIDSFIKSNDIDLTDYEEYEYVSFNDFFKRRVKKEARPVNYEPASFIAPCDGNLTVYRIDGYNELAIKNSVYTINDLLKDKKLAKNYNNGYCLVFRLCVDNYHRYHYVDNGIKSTNRRIDGILHTVQPIAVEATNVYVQNTREYTVLRTENFDDVIQMEVGAMLVGRICNYHEKTRFVRGQEKGCFEFGGSTIILFVKDGILNIDDEIISNSAQEIETPVKFGQVIGKRLYDLV